MEKYMLIAAIILFVFYKGYWALIKASLDKFDKIRIAYGMEYDFGIMAIIANLSKILSYVLAIISLILYIIKYL